MIQSIIKRDGRVVLYDQNKIASAILKALEAAREGDAADAARVANDVQRELEADFPNSSPNIEAIQDKVEQQLMNHGFGSAAKAYILYRANRTRAREANTSLMRPSMRSPRWTPARATSSATTPTSTAIPPWGLCSKLALQAPRPITRCISCGRSTLRPIGKATSISMTLTSTL